MLRTFITMMSAIVVAGMLSAFEARAHPAWGITVDRQGQVYFSDLETVWKIDAQGRLTVFRAGAAGRHTHDLNIDEAGNLYGADNSYEPSTQRFFSSIWKMTPAGDFSYLVSPTADLPEGTSIWRDRDGNMYHAATHPGRELLVLKRSRSGSMTTLIGSRSAAREYRQGVPYSAGGMSFGPGGALYLTHGANATRVSMNGAVAALIRNLVVARPARGATPAGVDNSPTHLFGIVADAAGSAFVADYGNQSVLKITADGRRSTLLRTEEPWFPTGVALRREELYILETGHTPTHAPIGTRVRKRTPDGRVVVLATVRHSRSP